ncbi:cytochrome C [uncultured Albimonas sp.]|uniref:c-type cytochrome n=1 Tax=uncultured Albimonas sp. TaxID=1331701 RepID=UPI0030ED25A5
MKRVATWAAIGTVFGIIGLGAAAPALAGDAAAGEKMFARCKACHAISNGDEVIQKGGRTGPDLYGVIGRKAGSVDGFRYGADLTAAGEKGLAWTEAEIAEYVVDPRAFLQAYLDDPSAKSSMTFKLRKGGEDVAAYLASVSP